MVLWSLVQSASLSMAVIVLISAVGVLCSIYPRSGRPILSPDARRDMGALCIQVAWPCIAVSSIGAAVHVEELREVWDLLLWCLAAKLVALALTGGAIWLLLGAEDGEMRSALLLMGTFGNAGALPMLMMGALCEQPVVRDRQASKDACLQDSYAYIMVYVAMWQLCMFGAFLPKRIAPYPLNLHAFKV